MNSSSQQQDELLATLLEQMLAASRSEGTQLLDDIIRKHPQLEGEIRELWTTVMMAEEFGVISNLSNELVSNEIADTFIPNVVAGTAASHPKQIGDYKINRIIGRGGMGIVYHAEQTALGRDVALKMLLQGELATPDDVTRFGREAEAAAGLQHPNIVPVYEVGSHAGLPFFSMKFVEGETLSERLTKGPLPPREAATLLVPICRAIEEAHQQNLLHRDLKPSNILIDEQGHPYVTDFGLAKRISHADISTSTTDDNSITQTGAILGTPSYMAPEQAAGGSRGDIDKQADVYSLGALLYAMLTGHAPFQAASPVDIIMMVLEQDPVPPRLLNSKADADLEMIALKCLQKPRDLRYASAGLLADDLECYLAGDPISARSSHFHQVFSRLFRETHNATLLQNWGLLWMLHAAVLLILTTATNIFQHKGITSRLPYMGLWVVGLSLWGLVFWKLRQRAGPITFVERQIAHVWGGSMIVSSLLYAVEFIMGLPVLSLSPALALVSGMVFLIKGSILTGAFYIQSAILFATAIIMAWIQVSPYPDVSISLFGIVSAACFFLPGLKYYLQRRS